MGAGAAGLAACRTRAALASAASSSMSAGGADADWDCVRVLGLTVCAISSASSAASSRSSSALIWAIWNCSVASRSRKAGSVAPACSMRRKMSARSSVSSMYGNRSLRTRAAASRLLRSVQARRAKSASSGSRIRATSTPPTSTGRPETPSAHEPGVAWKFITGVSGRATSLRPRRTSSSSGMGTALSGGMVAA